MKEYVGILLTEDKEIYMPYFKKNIKGYIHFYESYDQLLMQCDTYCTYLLIPLMYAKYKHAINLAISLHISIYQYYRFASSFQLFKLEKTDISHLLQTNQYDVLTIQQKAQKLRIAKEDILYVESSRNRIHICTIHENIQVRMRISEVLLLLDNPNFIRCHQSFILNMNYLYSLKRYEAILTSGDCIPISKVHSKEVRSFYERFYANG